MRLPHWILAAIIATAPLSAAPVLVGPETRVESIEVQGLGPALEAIVKQRLPVHAGDTLTVEMRHRLAEVLAAAGKDLGRSLTFTYAPGKKLGAVKLRISDVC
ncbi:MAG: hypothetical protein R2729_27260 [Bryobacteraceae bacterium]